MRALFIRSLEQIVNVLVVLALIAVVIGGLVTMFSGLPNAFMQGLAILIGGALYVVLIFGGIYLGLGIYENTRRTAEATEQLLRR